MQWDDIRYFLALSRQGSLSATSRALNVEHSTVSRRVGNLENELQVKLFDRLARGWVLTPEGKELFDRACAIEDEALSFQRAALGTAALAGTVRISAPPILISHFMLPQLGTVRSRYPEIALELIGERREADMVRGEADIAIRLGRPEEPGLIVRSIGDVSYGLYGRPDAVRRATGDQIYIGFDNSMPNLPQKLWLDEHVGARRYSLRSNDMMTMLQAARNGWGIALLPHFLARTSDELLELAEGVKPLRRPASLVMHADVRRSHRVRAVADILVEVFKARSCELQ
jgi:DNA-binding transcriptional LysR family regulator